MTPDEYEALIALGMDPRDINRPGGVNLGGLPNVGNGSPAFRNKKQQKAVGNLHARGDAPPPPQPNAPQGPQDAPRRPFRQQAAQGAPSAQGAFVDEFGPVAQGNHLQGMIAGVQKAYRDENRSRVEQAAAQQERDFEMEKERLRQESLLRRLAIEQEEREKDRILQRQLTTGVTRKRLVNGRWEDV